MHLQSRSLSPINRSSVNGAIGCNRRYHCSAIGAVDGGPRLFDGSA